MVRLLSMGVGVRLFIDTGVQIFGPFLAVIAAGLGTNIVTLGALNSVRSLTGLMAPVFGSLADRWGYRRTMRMTLLLGAAGMFVFGASNGLAMATLGVLLMGLCLFTFTPIMQAYMSAQIPYERRARGLGIVEYAWALAGIIGLSVSGLLIERFSWRTPFFVMGVALLVAFVVFGTLPKTRQADRPPALAPWRWRLAGELRQMLSLEEHARSAWSAIIANGLNVFAVAHIGIVYGTWLGEAYGLRTAQLGLVALTLGVADLLGSVLVSVLTDRFGKYRSFFVSTVAVTLAYAALPSIDISLVAAVAGLFVARFTFETSIVSNLSLLSEQIPSQRGQVLALGAVGVTIGVAFAGVTGPAAYTAWGVPGLGYVAAGASCLAAILAHVAVFERD
jgi:predicted MFS family arabinose efflux permease